MLYTILKILHVIGVVALVGNAVVTLIWKLAADRNGDPRVVAFAQRSVTLTDWWFTVGGVVLIALGGYGAAAVAGLQLFDTGWLVWGQVLFGISGILWVLILIPAQIRQARQARAFAASGEIPSSYWQDARRWVFWGIIATMTLLGAIGVMIAKPA
jgi:uncharacterized membrane protein